LFADIESALLLTAFVGMSNSPSIPERQLAFCDVSGMRARSTSNQPPYAARRRELRLDVA